LLTIPVAPMITGMKSISCSTFSEFLYLDFLYFNYFYYYYYYYHHHHQLQ
jgi:hypothetical protein